MKISDNCLKLVSKWEGFYAKAYLCPAKVWTIGYGTTRWTHGQAVKQGDTITQKEAWELLQIQVQQHANTIEQYVKVPLNQNQYDALASFQYNLGRHILKDSKLLTHLNNKNWQAAADLMIQYNKGGGKVLKGLVNRRKEEVALFLTPITKTESEDEKMKFINDFAKQAVRDRLEQAVKNKLIDKAHLTKFDNGELMVGDYIGLDLIIKQRSAVKK